MQAQKPRRKPLGQACDLREGYTHFLLACRSAETGAPKPVHPQRPG